MKVFERSFVLVACLLSGGAALAQTPELGVHITRQLPATPVKNQGSTGTCWCFSTTAVVESECLRKNLGEFDLSEMYIVRNIYLEKARNYVRRQGKAQFDEGGLGHDVLNAIAQYGAVPESAYSGLVNGARTHDHQKLVKDLRAYLTDILKKTPVPADWETGFVRILDERLGAIPQQFDYQGKTYTPRQFAEEVLQFHADDYIGLTSFSHHPFYQPFIVEIPDNWANGSYLNVPLEELSSVVQTSVSAGYTVMWDADVSNPGWGQDKGYALEYVSKPSSAEPDAPEKPTDQQVRQRLFDTQVTTDDHLMQITGMAASPSGKKFYLVKNSWGEVGPYKGYIYVSEPYFALNTVTVIVPKAVLPEDLKAKIH
ncbi:C1 family peptidase [Siphonobacter aquaeclarae]|uniref:Aminopeptidase n=1 Tax=Siphonobacter aquaeclarae TaxID=563176 RepID=A0A1G9UJZ9_9BACT|nr:C1 family peptidase [Siphonobacter aquaeclarae]SDM59865.1 bleomycin hydrolase [Siphonobacter aquaeclarae]